MYQTGQKVLYGTQGVCRIEAIEQMAQNGVKADYYVLRPVFDDRSTIFVPVQSEKLTGKMRPVLSVEQVQDLVDAMPQEELIWVDNEMERRDCYRTILSGGDRTKLVAMIKALHLHEKTMEKRGKRLHTSDDRFLHEAEKQLYEEFAHVLGIAKDQVLPYIFSRIGDTDQTVPTNA